MAIALTLERYLDAKNVKYDVIAHRPTNSSGETAETCHIPGDRLATGVLFRDDVDLATEGEIEDLFQDCVRGAIPAIGECYGLDMVVDDSIEEQPEVYFEGGDHATLVHMSHAQFADLTATARHGRFSVHH